MKQKLFILFSFALATLCAQGGTEVYWAELIPSKNSFTFGAITNISQNPGYDNQPSFWSDNVLLYAATRNGQTDILRHNIATAKKEWHSATLQGSEYSPLRIPSTETISAIRLDTTGLQRLYRYKTKGEYNLLFPELKIGYHLWVSPTRLLFTVLVENRMDLYSGDFQTGKTERIAQKVGRSLHKIPGKAAISFIQWDGKTAKVIAYDLQAQKTETLADLPQGVQDMAWLPNGELLYGKGNTLYRQSPRKKAMALHTFPSSSLKNISRIAIGPDGKKIALVGEE